MKTKDRQQRGCAHEAWCGQPAPTCRGPVRCQGGVPPPQELAGRGCVRTSLFDPLPNPRYLRARSYRRLKAFLMAAEALLQAWSSGMARKAALKGSAWMGPS